ncbi:hypothetical protein QBC39DRAFT_352944 [Podospora conica]|nr:hypothetical protein QBC39DRAFT_352944 [Schizothecium conicum]
MAAAVPWKDKTKEEPVRTRQESCPSQPRLLLPASRQAQKMALSTSMTSFFSSPTATAPVLAFTTPFPQPASCSSPVLTTTVSTYNGSQTTTYMVFYLPDTSDPRYTACLAPAGGQFTFSPAVCPEGWPAWWLGTTSHASHAVSTAYCCLPGYTMRSQPSTEAPSPTPSCELFVARPDERISRLPAWHISWQPTDIPTMSPKPPAIEGDRITMWVPGSDPEREPPQRGSDGGYGAGLMLASFMMIGLPIICVVGLIACVTACCSRGNRGWSRGLRATPAPTTS